MRILAIDPGNQKSGWCIIDAHTRRPKDFGKTNNQEFAANLAAFMDDGETPIGRVVIEMVGHYGTGMPAGKTVFDTCVWIGRYIEIVHQLGPFDLHTELILRQTVKAHICGTTKATDSNVTQALKDRFAPGVRNHGKGTKADPGWFYGFRADVWQAYALAVYMADQLVPPLGGVGVGVDLMAGAGQ